MKTHKIFIGTLIGLFAVLVVGLSVYAWQKNQKEIRKLLLEQQKQLKQKMEQQEKINREDNQKQSLNNDLAQEKLITKDEFYSNENFGILFKSPENLYITKETKEAIILSDRPRGHWVLTIQSYDNLNNQSLNDVFEIVLAKNTKSLGNNQPVKISTLEVGGLPAKKYSIQNYHDYGNVGIVIVKDKHIFEIHGDDLVSPINATFQKVIESVVFVN